MIRFLGLLFLVFLALKLAEIGVVETWSWWWVTAPLWVVPALLVAIPTALLLLAVVCISIDTAASGLRRMLRE